jgi:hypothetical protein
VGGRTIVGEAEPRNDVETVAWTIGKSTKIAF